MNRPSRLMSRPGTNATYGRGRSIHSWDSPTWRTPARARRAAAVILRDRGWWPFRDGDAAGARRAANAKYC
jgi:hypothetical protein